MDFEIPDAGVLVALVALLATILYRWRAAQRRDFEILLARTDKEAEKRQAQIDNEAEKRQAQIDNEAEKRQAQIDNEAEKRERAFQAALDRSDRNFETLLARSNELAKGLASIAERTTRNEGVLETITAGERPMTPNSPSARDEPRAVAAQKTPDEPPAE